MTVAEMKQSDKTFLTASDVAAVLNCDPQAVRIMARTKPERLGFPVILVRTRLKIPRVPFLRYMGLVD